MHIVCSLLEHWMARRVQCAPERLLQVKYRIVLDVFTKSAK